MEPTIQPTLAYRPSTSKSLLLVVAAWAMTVYSIYLVRSHQTGALSSAQHLAIVAYVVVLVIGLPLAQKSSSRKDLIEKKLIIISALIVLVPWVILFQMLGIYGLYLGVAIDAIILFGLGGFVILYQNVLNPKDVLTITDTDFLFYVRGIRSTQTQGVWSEVSGMRIVNLMNRNLYLVLTLPDTSPLYTRYPNLQRGKNGMTSGMLGSPLNIRLNLLNVNNTVIVGQLRQFAAAHNIPFEAPQNI